MGVPREETKRLLETASTWKALIPKRLPVTALLSGSNSWASPGEPGLGSGSAVREGE